MDYIIKEQLTISAFSDSPLWKEISALREKYPLEIHAKPSIFNTTKFAQPDGDQHALYIETLPGKCHQFALVRLTNSWSRLTVQHVTALYAHPTDTDTLRNKGALTWWQFEEVLGHSATMDLLENVLLNNLTVRRMFEP